MKGGFAVDARARGGGSPVVEERRTTVGDRTVRYLAAGEGPPVVLLHALGENALDWSWTMPALSRSNRLYAPDLPGIGDGGTLADPSPPFFASFVASFLDSLGIDRTAVVGNSLGGLVALALPGYGEAAIAFSRAPGFLETVLGALRAQIQPRGQREVLLGRLPGLTSPALVVWGAHDRVFPRQHARDAVDRLEKGRLVLMPDCGHLPQVEHPDRFAGVLGRFLDEVTAHGKEEER